MRITYNQDLTHLNTFAVKASCDKFIQIEDEDEIRPLLETDELNSAHYILGGGSNVLFTQHFHGAIVQLCTKGIHKFNEDTDFIWLDVAAGEHWDDFVNYCVKNKYYGVENLSGIPGFVGSCPVQNIGAYSAEVKDVIDSVFGYRISSKQPFTLANADCQFGYRSSIFKTTWKGDVLITRVRFKLSKKEKLTVTYKGLIEEMESSGLPLSLENVAKAVVAVRNNKLPDIREIGCAGSFFKNPIVKEEVRNKLLSEFPNIVTFPADNGMYKLAAGQLIELSGMKGVREGCVGVFPKQALVIVNYGGATGEEIRQFYRKVQEAVERTTGVRLEPEVNIL